MVKDLLYERADAPIPFSQLMEGKIRSTGKSDGRLKDGEGSVSAGSSGGVGESLADLSEGVGWVLDGRGFRAERSPDGRVARREALKCS